MTAVAEPSEVEDDEDDGGFTPGWPRKMDDAAFRGLAGDVVRAIEPHTEADRHAVLLAFLASFGNAVGRNPHKLLGATRQPARLFVALVGSTSDGRKGEAWSPIKLLWRKVDALGGFEYVKKNVRSGLSSGEGLIMAVSDRVESTQTDPKTGRVKPVVVNEGVADKRLLAVEAELMRVLISRGREGNTLSPILRDAWDDGTRLEVLTKHPYSATDPHISILTMTTPQELARGISDTDAYNGFGNRFLWCMSERSKVLAAPEPFAPSPELVQRVRDAVAKAAFRTEPIEWSEDALHRYTNWYEWKTDARRGDESLAASMTARWAPQVVRLALIYALLDGSSVIELSHLQSAVAVWVYCDATVDYLFAPERNDAGLLWLRERGGAATVRELARAGVCSRDHSYESVEGWVFRWNAAGKLHVTVRRVAGGEQWAVRLAEHKAA